MDKKIVLATTIHNRKQYLRPCIESALKSSLDTSLWLHCLLDNGSTDGALEIAEEYAEKYDHIKLVKFPTNQQQMPAYNFCLDLVEENYPTIDYFCCLDSDDRVSVRALEVCYNLFESNSDIEISYSDFNEIDSKNRVLTKRHPKSKRRVPRKNETSKESQKMYRRIQLNKKSGNICTHFRFIRLKSLLSKVGMFPEEFQFATDFLIYSSCLGAEMNLVKIDEVLYHWRNHQKAGKGSGNTRQVEKDHGAQQRADYLTLRDAYEAEWTRKGLI